MTSSPYVEGILSPFLDQEAKADGPQRLWFPDTLRHVALSVPRSYTYTTPLPLLVLLHGANENERGMLLQFDNYYKKTAPDPCIIMCIKSQRDTWHLHRLDLDSEHIDSQLRVVLKLFNVDRTRIGIGGFSDGATLALTLGQVNGDLFSHVLAFSPGQSLANPTIIAKQQKKAKIFIAHGIRDVVLPIDKCSRKIVPKLGEQRFEFLYHEFGEGHLMTQTTKERALQFFLQ